MKGVPMTPDNIRAIKENRKTVTRRLDGLKEINKEPDRWEYKGCPYSIYQFDHKITGERITVMPRYQVNEVVYIKEAWRIDFAGKVHYKLDNSIIPNGEGLWHSPMFLKANLARYFIQITDVRPERLQEITDKDCQAEGCQYPQWQGSGTSWKGAYKALWDSINAKSGHGWDKNDWVFRYEFKIVPTGG